MYARLQDSRGTIWHQEFKLAVCGFEVLNWIASLGGSLSYIYEFGSGVQNIDGYQGWVINSYPRCTFNYELLTE